jgi:hypothetical protein
MLAKREEMQLNHKHNVPRPVRHESRGSGIDLERSARLQCALGKFKYPFRDVLRGHQL